MEKDTEKPINDGEKMVERNPDGTIKSGVLNPNGKPKGTNNFKTDWENFIKKVAKSNNMSEIEINEQLLAVGFKKAKEGDYAFYRDIHDRVYGKAVQIVETDTPNKVNNTYNFLFTKEVKQEVEQIESIIKSKLTQKHVQNNQESN